tara:strand:- start:149 stop:898 length:750 start_codon:yes stop_codon:yes gene_type:complete
MEKDKKSDLSESLEEINDTAINDDIEPMQKEDYDDLLPAKVTPKKKEKWAGLSDAKKAHLIKLNENNRKRFKAEKEAKTQLLQDAKEIVRARKTIKEMDIKEQENKKLLEKAAKIVRGKGRPKKKPLLESESESESESEEEVVEQEVEESEEEVIEQEVEESEEEVIEKPKKKKKPAKPVKDKVKKPSKPTKPVKDKVKKPTKPVKDKVKKPVKRKPVTDSSSSEEEMERVKKTPPEPVFRQRQFSFFV